MKQHKHIGESIRLFNNPILESFSHVHPIIPLVLWGPISLYFFYRSYAVKEMSIVAMIIVSIFGLFLWTFTEYALHRFVFHYEAQSAPGKRFIYLMHGIHHDDPLDATRLVMPPVPGIIIFLILRTLFALVIPDKFIDCVMASFLVGYLSYDYIHYATHHFAMTSKLGKFWRKYHLQHHYCGLKCKYGVSSPLWDYVFKTVTGPKYSKT